MTWSRISADSLTKYACKSHFVIAGYYSLIMLCACVDTSFQQRQDCVIEAKTVYIIMITLFSDSAGKDGFFRWPADFCFAVFFYTFYVVLNLFLFRHTQSHHYDHSKSNRF